MVSKRWTRLFLMKNVGMHLHVGCNCHWLDLAHICPRFCHTFCLQADTAVTALSPEALLTDVRVGMCSC